MNQDITPEQIETTRQLIKKAKEGKHTDFQFIHNLHELAATKKFLYIQKKLIKGFTKPLNACMKVYLQSINTDDDRIDLVISIKEIQDCIKFYTEEQTIIKDMIKEYVCYIHSNHLIKTLLYIDRPKEDETD